MKTFILFFLLACMATASAFGQCRASFTSSATYEEVTFTNHSVVANAHYFWNFGDGTSSLYKDPVHTFPGSGKYFVSLFIKDTISSCGSYDEKWIDVVKYSTDTCQPAITDTFADFGNGEMVSLIDVSVGCPAYNHYYDYAGGSNISTLPNWEYLHGWNHARFVNRVQYFDGFSGLVRAAAYKSLPYHYTGAKNYSGCSANFEFYQIPDSSGRGQRIIFKAMNNNAASYKWEIIGFGNPIYSSKDTISHVYPFVNVLWPIALTVTGAGGCKDTFLQEIRVDTNSTRRSLSAASPNKLLGGRSYPNPFTEQTTIEFPLGNEEASFALYNSLGQVVRQKGNIRTGKIVVDGNGLPPGLYYYRINTSGNKTGSGKLVLR